MHCCGHDGQVIELRGGREPLQMVRCTTCARREWLLGDEPVAVDDAFAVLAQAYRAVPRSARAARQRAAAQTTARAAVRAAAQAAAQAAAHVETAASPPAPPAPAPVDREDLARLLAGWTVLGATG